MLHLSVVYMISLSISTIYAIYIQLPYLYDMYIDLSIYQLYLSRLLEDLGVGEVAAQGPSLLRGHLRLEHLQQIGIGA